MDPGRRLLVMCLDLTSLGDTDDEAGIEAMCARAKRPVPGEPQVSVAAVCVWPRLVPVAVRALAGSGVRVAAATGGFPDASGPLAGRLEEIEGAIEAGAHEVDVVVNRGLRDDPRALAAELAATRAVASGVVWKAILETGALPREEMMTLARLGIDAGVDFLKTSTGKGHPGATPAAVADLAGLIGATGGPVGLKVSGGVRTAEDALRYLAIVCDTLGTAWLDPTRFRIGASALLDDLLRG
jgi:deoxyribose-phosphate aldolase